MSWWLWLMMFGLSVFNWFIGVSTGKYRERVAVLQRVRARKEIGADQYDERYLMLEDIAPSPGKPGH